MYVCIVLNTAANVGIKELYSEYKRISKVVIFQSFFNERPFKSVKSFFKIDEKEKSWNFFDICIT